MPPVRWLGFTLLTLAVLLVALCLLLFVRQHRMARDVRAVAAAAERCLTAHQTHDRWHSSVAFPYVSPIPQSKWAERARMLQKGESTADVFGTFGEPDYVLAMASKQGDRFYGCAWFYQVRNVEDTVNYKTGSWIEISFEKSDGRVVDYSTVNIDNLPNRGVP